MTHLTETQLNELAEGGRDEQARAHVQACAGCRGEVEALRALILEVQSLPRGIQPTRNLLAGIHDAIDRDQVLPLREPRRVRALRELLWPLSAAAVLLIVATAVLTRVWLERGAAPTATVESAPATRLVGQESRALSQKYESAIAELEQLVEAQRAQLAPETLRLLEQNLKTIDRAIRESRAALESDPNSALVHEMLRSIYEQKLDLLRRATAVET